MSDQPETHPTPGPVPGMQRRAVLRAAGLVGAGGVGAAALAACGGSTTPAVSGGVVPPAKSSSGSGSGSGGIAVPVADVPVGGGKAFPDASPPYVVTQPTSGQFKAFDGTCTHQGCPVTTVRNGHIVCPCHGSQFDISTGAPTSSSEARKPLTAKTATVNGSSVVIT
jgi:Rieske Fe-S protein